MGHEIVAMPRDVSVAEEAQARVCDWCASEFPNGPVHSRSFNEWLEWMSKNREDMTHAQTGAFADQWQKSREAVMVATLNRPATSPAHAVIYLALECEEYNGGASGKHVIAEMDREAFLKAQQFLEENEETLLTLKGISPEIREVDSLMKTITESITKALSEASEDIADRIRAVDKDGEMVSFEDAMKGSVELIGIGADSESYDIEPEKKFVADVLKYMEQTGEELVAVAFH